MMPPFQDTLTNTVMKTSFVHLRSPCPSLFALQHVSLLTSIPFICLLVHYLFPPQEHKVHDWIFVLLSLEYIYHWVGVGITLLKE